MELTARSVLANIDIYTRQMIMVINIDIDKISGQVFVLYKY